MAVLVPVRGTRVARNGARIGRPSSWGGSDPGPAPSGDTLHTFTLRNTSAGGSTAVYARLGLAFLAGDVPVGSRLKVRVQGGADVDFAAAVAGNTWADGSLRSTADNGLVMIDSNSIAAGSSRTYEVYAATGSQAASSLAPWTAIAGLSNDMTVALTSRSGGDDTTNRTFSLKTAVATTTRREIVGDTSRFVRVRVWQKVTGEEHLICENHLDFWLAGDGSTIKAMEWAPVLSQHWWVADPFGSAQTKTKQTYTATVACGGSTVDTRAGLSHAYYCRWASLRSADDAQHGRKHWINHDGSTPLPTLRVAYSDASLQRMMRAGYVPPLRLGVAYSSSYPTTYVPLGANGHRSGINDTGGYAGRGIWPDPDSQLVSLQGSATAATAETAWRKSRVMAQAALAVGWHVRDHRSTSGVNGGTDTTNRLVPHVFRKISASYSGLAGPAVMSRYSSDNSFYSSTSGLTVLTHGQPAGGDGAFSSSSTIDSSHAVNYGGPMAFLEGEAYLGDATLSQVSAALWKAGFSQYGTDRNLIYANTARGAALSIPDPADSSRYGHLLDTDGSTQERAIAWAVNLLAAAYAAAGDGRPEQPWLKNLALNEDAWLSASFAYFTSDHYSRGGFFIDPSNGGGYSPWMCHFQGLAFYHAARLLADVLPDNARGLNGFEEVAMVAGTLAINAWRYAPQTVAQYHSAYSSEATCVTTLPLAEQPFEVSCSISGNTFTTSISGTYPPSVVLANGDKIRFIGRNTGLDNESLPSGITQYQLYYLVQVSGSTFKISASPGGSAVSVGAGSVTGMLSPQSATLTTVLPSSQAGDTRDMLCMALLEEAIGMGHAGISGSDASDIRALFATAAAASTGWATWNYDGGNLG